VGAYPSAALQDYGLRVCNKALTKGKGDLNISKSPSTGAGLLLFICLILLVPSQALSTEAAKPASPIEEYALPTPLSHPIDLAIDSGGKVWYAAQKTDRIGVFDDGDKKFREFLLPEGSSPAGIATGTDGVVWFTMPGASAIGSLPRSGGKVSVHKVPSKNAEPYMITVAKDGNVWFTERNANMIGVYNGKAFREFEVATANSQPTGIALDSGGRVWFTEAVGNNIGFVDLSKKIIREYRIPTPYANPAGMAIDSADHVWFVEMNGNRVCMFDPATAVFNEAIIPTQGSVPARLAIAPDGIIWFTESRTNKIGRFDPVTAAFTEYTVPTYSSFPLGIGVDGSGKVWFTESARDANRLSSLKAPAVTAEKDR